MNEKPITVSAELVEHRDARLAFVTLPNGKRILAHLAKTLKIDLTSLEIGTKLTLEMTTFDFEKGRIINICE